MTFSEQVAIDMATMLTGEAAEPATIKTAAFSVVVQRLGSRVENLPLLDDVQGGRAVLYIPDAQAVAVNTEITLTASGEVWRALRRLSVRPGLVIWDCVSNTSTWGR
jgi:hypothetical protein